MKQSKRRFLVPGTIAIPGLDREIIDDTQVGSIDVSIGKARTALAFKRPTKALEDAVDALAK